MPAVSYLVVTEQKMSKTTQMVNFPVKQDNFVNMMLPLSILGWSPEPDGDSEI